MSNREDLRLRYDGTAVRVDELQINDKIVSALGPLTVLKIEHRRVWSVVTFDSLEPERTPIYVHWLRQADTVDRIN